MSHVSHLALHVSHRCEEATITADLVAGARPAGIGGAGEPGPRDLGLQPKSIPPLGGCLCFVGGLHLCFCWRSFVSGG